MAEPEELIVDFAHRGVVSAHRLWLRLHPGADEAARGLPGLRTHLDLLLAGLADRPVTLVPADPPAPSSWVARLTRPTPSHLRGIPPPAATDGDRIYLPRSMPPELESALPPAAAYRLLLVEQLARVVRGSSIHAPGDPATPLHILYELAEASACDRWIVETLPGLGPDLLRARRAMVTRRPAPHTLWPLEATIERLVRGLLGGSFDAPASGVPCPATPAESRRWAEQVLSTLSPADKRFRGLPPVALWGRVLPAAAPPGPVPALRNPVPAPEPPAPGRISMLRRAPRPREAGADEDEGRMGTWIIRPDEPQESVEDPFGIQRPADRDEEAVPDELADALADLPETRVVSTPDPAREVLASEGLAPRGSRPPPGEARAEGVVYPEWDCRMGGYRLHGAVVREVPLTPGDGTWARAALARHATLVRQVRRQFALLRPRRILLRRQPDGTDLDLEAWVETWADRRAGVAEAANEDRLYLNERPARRSLAIALLIDVSASTDSWVTGSRRVIDIEKEALLVVGEALAQLGERHGIFAFSGEGPGGVRVRVVKDFAEATGPALAARIAGLEPDRYTRVGAAIRHVTARLAEQAAERRLLLLLTDGRPNDVDQYEGRYGVEDTRQAVREATLEGALVFGLTVDLASPAYLSTMFGPGRSALLRRPERLPSALIEVLRRLLAST